MNFKPIEKSDLNFLLSANGYFKDGWTESMFNSAFATGNFHGFIAEDRADDNAENCGIKTGFITFTVSVDTADIEDLFVFPDFRNKGTGGALIDKAIEHLTVSGIKKAFLEVRESNAAAISLYKKAGFSAFSVRKKYYADGENAICMAREIKE